MGLEELDKLPSEVHSEAGGDSYYCAPQKLSAGLETA